jgi:hypothetical protein
VKPATTADVLRALALIRQRLDRVADRIGALTVQASSIIARLDAIGRKADALAGGDGATWNPYKPRGWWGDLTSMSAEDFKAKTDRMAARNGRKRQREGMRDRA